MPLGWRDEEAQRHFHRHSGLQKVGRVFCAGVPQAAKNVADFAVAAGVERQFREDLLARVPANLPLMLDYKLMADNKSLFNTPPCYSIYMVGLVLKWLKALGGLPGMNKMNQEKANLLYHTIDQSGGFYRGHARPEARSIMNVPFRMPNEELEEQFVKEAKKADLIGIKGHRSVGGLRASIYNALPLDSVKALTTFMQEFQKKAG